MSRKILIPVFLAMLCCIFVASHNVLPNSATEWNKALVWCNFMSKNMTGGFFISEDGIIVAPFHLFKDWIIFHRVFPIFIATYDKKVYRANVLLYNETHDLLFLQVAKYKPEFWFSEYETPKEGQKCFVVGFPRGWRTIKEAKIIIHFQADMFGVDWQPLPGSSGAAIVSENGRILGILTKGAGLTIITLSETIRSGLILIRENQQQRK